mmetsp:Transcript_5348/g.12808  ORF Transcript_5348/g.12808 Transcript_5348/m.12808 type:complete len:263 (-) Transcript_5348:617-1405(-)
MRSSPSSAVLGRFAILEELRVATATTDVGVPASPPDLEERLAALAMDILGVTLPDVLTCVCGTLRFPPAAAIVAAIWRRRAADGLRGLDSSTSSSSSPTAAVAIAGGAAAAALAHSIPWHSSGRSRRNSALWNAPASGPREIWRNPHRFSLRVNDGYLAAVGRRSIRARFRLVVEVEVAVASEVEAVEVVEAAAEVPEVLLLVEEALSGKYSGSTWSANTSGWRTTKDWPCGSHVMIRAMVGSDSIRRRRWGKFSRAGCFGW